MGEFVEENSGQEKKKDQVNIFNQPVKTGSKGLGRKKQGDGADDKSE
jgi:hypothetical protein